MQPLRKLHAVGERLVSDEGEMLSLCSAECHNIVLALSNYDRPAQEQFMGAIVMSLLRLGAKPDDVRAIVTTTLEMVLAKAEEICARDPFPCQRTGPIPPIVSERNFYEQNVAK